MKNNKRTSMIFSAISVLFLFLIAIPWMFTNDVLGEYEWYSDILDNADKVPYVEYSSRVHDGEVTDIWYNEQNQYMIFRSTVVIDVVDKLYTAYSPMRCSNEDYNTTGYFYVTDYPANLNFRKGILDRGINLYLVKSSNNKLELVQMVSMLVPAIGLTLMILYGMKAMTPTKDISAEEVLQVSNVSLKDIIGLDEITDDINLIIKLMKDPKYGENIGAKMPKGVLLSGAPGVGKTMIAQAISHETGLPFISVSGSDFKEVYAGNGAKRIRSVFRIAREKSPCIIFIDELDAIGEKRNSIKANSEDVQTINALLKEMDGFKKNDGIFVLAATNHPDNLDAAVTRAGRFDREIVIRPPKDWKDCKKLFQLYLKDKKVSDDVDLDTLARTVSSFTGADISAVCNEAALVALSRNMEMIDHDCLEEAIDKRLFKGSRSKKEVVKKDKEIVAYHEASHAVASILTGQPVSRITIQSTTSGVGGAVLNEQKDSCFMTKDDYENRVIVCYAGRVAEQLKFNSVTTGASNDITQATLVIDEYINKLGFCSDGAAIDKASLTKAYGPMDLQDDLITKVAKELYNRCEDLIKQNFDMVETLATRLLEVEKMTGKQVYEFLHIEPNLE